MFGYVKINKKLLSKENIEKYRSFYCGLCHVLGEKYGLFSRLTLTYDMTFLALFQSILYGEEVVYSDRRCIVHPVKRHNVADTESLHYAAAMNVILAYYKCADDWHDDKNLIKGAEVLLLKTHIKKIKEAFPRQCSAIENCIAKLTETENNGILNADIPANIFGELMGELFCKFEDDRRDLLYKFGFDLGKFIYIMDAYCDIKTDLRKEKYNPLVNIPKSDIENILQMLAAAFINDFEQIQPACDDEILKNILYSGVWIHYAKLKQDEEKKDGDDKNAG